MKFLIPATSLGVALLTAQEILPETVVVASAIEEESPPGSTKLRAAELLKRGSVTLPDALQREPGVSVPLDISGGDTLVPYLQGGSQGINIRGLQGDRIEILVDGIPQADDSTTRTFQGSGGPGRIYFDPAVFAELELFKSVAPGSGSLAGTLAGRTESPFTLLGPDLDGFRFKSTTSYATSNSSWNERLATAWGNGTIASSLIYSYRTGHELENNGDIVANPSDYESHALVWKNVYRQNDWTFEQTLDYFRTTSFTDLDSIEVTSQIGTTTEATNDTERERFRFSLDFKNDSQTTFTDDFSGKLYFQSSRSNNLNLQSLISPAGPRNRTNDLHYQTDIAGLNLTASKEWDDLAFTARYLGSWKDISGALRRTDDPLPEINLPNLAPSQVWDHALALSAEISLGDRWTITPSVRIQDYRVRPENTDDFLAQSRLPVFDEFGLLIGERTIEAVDYENFTLSPSLHFEFTASEEWSLFGSYVNSHRNPTAEELGGVFVHPDNVSISLPNPNLEAENSHSFEVGARFKNDRWASSLTAYYNRYGNFLEGSVPTGEVIDGLDVLRTENTRDAEIYGVELKTEWQGERFRSGASFAWSEGSADGGPLNTVEPLKAVAWLGYDHPDEQWGLELSSTFVGAKTRSQISGDLAPTDSYFLVDLTAYYQLSDNIVLRGGVKNLLDEQYILWSRANRGGGHNGVTNSRDTQPGINGFVSISFDF